MITLKDGYLPKIAIALLVVAAVSIFMTGQIGQVHATTTTTTMPQGCYSYSGGYYYNYTYAYYYGYPYYYDYYYGYPYYYYYSYPYSYYSYPYYYCDYGYYYGYYPYNYGYSYNYYPYSYGYGYYPTSKYTLTVATDPSNLGTVTGGGSYTQGSSASFSVTKSVVQVDDTTRYVFSNWSGGYSGSGTSGSITLNGNTKITAVYQLQYYLSVNSQPQNAPTADGAGWYNAGQSVQLNAPTQTVQGDSSSRLVFQGWSVDGTSPQETPSITVTMNSPHSVATQYKQQYYLNVMSNQGVASGSGWYDAGSTAQAYASTPQSTSYGISYVFNGWQGDIQSPSQTASVAMDKPKTVIASWGTDSTILNLTIAGVVIAVFLAAAGIIAYVVTSRNRQQTYQPQYYAAGPTIQQGPAAPPPPATYEYQQPALRKKTIPKKRTTTQETTTEDTTDSSTQTGPAQ